MIDRQSNMNSFTEIEERVARFCPAAASARRASVRRERDAPAVALALSIFIQKQKLGDEVELCLKTKQTFLF